jgi:hypothetical protein
MIHRTIVLKLLVVAFCVWHMTTIGFLSVAATVKGSVAEWVDDEIAPHFVEYKNVLFRQHQSWRPFSNPERRVRTYELDTAVQGGWMLAASITPEALGWRERSYNLKLVRNLFGSKTKNKRRQTAYVHMLCRREGIEPDTRVRLRETSFLIPKEEIEHTLTYWHHWVPEKKMKTVLTTRCPDA